MLFSLTGFIGFEATAVFRDEARDPERTIPRATYAAVLIIGGFYALTCWAFVVAIGPDQVAEVAQRTLDGDANMLLDTTDDTLGRVGRDVVNVLLLTSLFACVLSFHNVIARYQFVLAGKGLLPAPARYRAFDAPLARLLLGGADDHGGDDRVAPCGVRGRPAGRGVRLDGRCGDGRHGAADAHHVDRGAGVLRPPPRRRRVAASGRPRIAPALACVGLLASLWLVLSNFTLVTGGSAALSAVLAAVPFVGLLIGYFVGQPDRPAVSTAP